VPASALLGASPLTLRAAVDVSAKAAQIDKLVAENLAKNKLQPNAPAIDEVFVRRAYLDIVGRIPTLKETTGFPGRQERRQACEIDRRTAGL